MSSFTANCVKYCENNGNYFQRFLAYRHHFRIPRQSSILYTLTPLKTVTKIGDVSVWLTACQKLKYKYISLHNKDQQRVFQGGNIPKRPEQKEIQRIKGAMLVNWHC